MPEVRVLSGTPKPDDEDDDRLARVDLFISDKDMARTSGRICQYEWGEAWNETVFAIFFNAVARSFVITNRYCAFWHGAFANIVHYWLFSCYFCHNGHHRL